MKSDRQSLEESRNFWAGSAKLEKKQFLFSLASAAGGMALVGVGIKSAVEGDVAGGLVAIGAGGSMAAVFGKLGLEEIQDFTDSTSKVAIKQSQLDEFAS